MVIGTTRRHRSFTGLHLITRRCFLRRYRLRLCRLWRAAQNGRGDRRALLWRRLRSPDGGDSVLMRPKATQTRPTQRDNHRGDQPYQQEVTLLSRRRPIFLLNCCFFGRSLVILRRFILHSL